MQLALNLIPFFKIKDRKNQFLNMQLLILFFFNFLFIYNLISATLDLAYCLMGKDKTYSLKKKCLQKYLRNVNPSTHYSS